MEEEEQKIVYIGYEPQIINGDIKEKIEKSVCQDLDYQLKYFQLKEATQLNLKTVRRKTDEENTKIPVLCQIVSYTYYKKKVEGKGYSEKKLIVLCRANEWNQRIKGNDVFCCHEGGIAAAVQFYIMQVGDTLDWHNSFKIANVSHITSKNAKASFGRLSSMYAKKEHHEEKKKKRKRSRSFTKKKKYNTLPKMKKDTTRKKTNQNELINFDCFQEEEEKKVATPKKTETQLLDFFDEDTIIDIPEAKTRRNTVAQITHHNPFAKTTTQYNTLDTSKSWTPTQSESCSTTSTTMSDSSESSSLTPITTAPQQETNVSYSKTPPTMRAKQEDTNMKKKKETMTYDEETREWIGYGFGLQQEKPDTPIDHIPTVLEEYPSPSHATTANPIHALAKRHSLVTKQHVPMDSFEMNTEFLNEEDESPLSSHEAIEKKEKKDPTTNHRIQLMLEIIEQEVGFGESLEQLKTYYRLPMKGLIPTALYDLCFKNVQVIEVVHNQVFKMIGNIVEDPATTKTISEAQFTKLIEGFCTFAPSFRLYCNYFEKLAHVLELLKENMKHKKFAKFLKKTTDELKAKACRRRTLTDFLQQPLQHVTRYRLIFRAMTKKSLDTTYEASLNMLVDQLNQTLQFLNRKKGAYDLLRQAFELHARLQSHFNVCARHRHLNVAPIRVIRFKPPSKYYFGYLWIFSDTLIFEDRDRPHKNRHKQLLYPFRDLSWKSLPSPQQQGSSTTLITQKKNEDRSAFIHCLTIITNTSTFYFQFADDDAIRHIIDAQKNYLDYLNRKTYEPVASSGTIDPANPSQVFSY